MITDFPELNPLVANRRKYENNIGVLPDSFTANVGIPVEEGAVPAKTSNIDDTASGADNGKGNMDKEKNINENLPILDAETLEAGLPQEGKRKSQGLMIGFYDNKDSNELGKLEDGTVWINNEHPAYKRVAKNNSEKYHIVVSTAFVLSDYLQEEKSSQTFINRFLSNWGKEA
jgi:hypothetical protein